MQIIVSDSRFAEATIRFGEAKRFSEAAKRAKDDAERREAYAQKAECLSRLCIDCPEYVIIEFDHQRPRYLSVRLDRTPATDGLHVPIRHLDPLAIEVIMAELRRESGRAAA